MHAIVSIDGGRQYRVEEGQQLLIDYRGGDVSEGQELTFDQILGYVDGEKISFGTPTLAGATVTAKVLGHTKGDKVVIQKFNRRKNYRRRTGHRQKFTEVEITKISLG